MDELTDEERILIDATRHQVLALVANDDAEAAERYLVPLLDRARRARARACFLSEIEEVLEEVRLRPRAAKASA